MVTEGALPVCAEAAAVKRMSAENETREARRTRIPCLPCSEIERKAIYFLVPDFLSRRTSDISNKHLRTNASRILLSLLRLLRLYRDGSRLSTRRLRIQCFLYGIFDLTLAFESDNFVYHLP